MIKTIVKVTRAQMIALENGDPVGTHTYDPEHCLYMVDDGLELPTTNGSYVITTTNGGNSFSYTSAAGKVFTNVTVSANSWSSDQTYSNYPYKAVIACSGVTADMVMEVIFNVTEAASGDYAPVCISGTNTVTIFSASNASITIPVIKEIR